MSDQAKMRTAAQVLTDRLIADMFLGPSAITQASTDTATPTSIVDAIAEIKKIMDAIPPHFTGEVYPCEIVPEGEMWVATITGNIPREQAILECLMNRNRSDWQPAKPRLYVVLCRPERVDEVREQIRKAVSK